MVFQDLTKKTVTLYKGLGIFLIVAHNFMHRVDKLPRENQFSFDYSLLESFLYQLTHQTADSYRIIMSYLGHFGVQIFIFLSAYGLSKKFLNIESIDYFKFIKGRIFKLYPPFLLAIILWLLYEGFCYSYTGPIKYLYWNWESLFLKLTFLSNIVPHEAMKPQGPWWFLPFIVQFYLVFPFLRGLFLKKGIFPLVIISLLGLQLTYHLRDVDFNFFATILGHLPEFSLGIFLAHRKNFEFSLLWIPFFLGLFILGNFFEPFWYLSHFSALVLILFLFRISFHLINRWDFFSHKVFVLGNLSMYVFLVNSFLRYPFLTWAQKSPTWYSNLYFGAVSFIVVIFASYGLFKLEFYIRAQTRLHYSKLANYWKDRSHKFYPKSMRVKG